jgi:hypothetical protein
MIVSHSHRFIFAAVPKTGTHSVRQALREQLGDDDVEQVGLFVDKRFPWEDLAAIRHGHLSLRQVRPYLGDEAFSDYFKFAFVRNPFDRFVSYCAFMLRGGDVFEQRPREVMRHFLFAEPPEQHILFQPQASLLVDEDGQTLLATASVALRTCRGRMTRSARVSAFPPARSTGSTAAAGDYRRYYDQALIDGVAARYAQDLELFGYTFEGPR